MKFKILLPTILALLLGSCGGINPTPAPVVPTKLDSPVVVYNEQTKVMSWENVENANSYKVYDNYNLVTSINETSYTISITDYEKHEFYVTSNDTTGSHKESDASNKIAYRNSKGKLAAPQIRWVPVLFRLLWEPIEHADYYEVYDKNKIVSISVYPMHQLKADDFDTHTFTVIARDSTNEYASSVPSNSIACKHSQMVLDEPVISLEGNVVSWNIIPNASKYEIFVNGESKNIQDSCSYSINETDYGEYKITVRAIGYDGPAEVISDFSNEARYVISEKLAAPTISVSDKVVSWEAVANAGSYSIYVNDALKDTITKTSYTFTETSFGTYEIEVVAKASSDLYLDSDRSNKVTISVEPTKLAAPTIGINANVISWSAVKNAASYDVYVNNAVAANITTTSYTISDIGNHAVEVVAKPASSKYTDSAKSNTITFNTTAEQLWLYGLYLSVTPNAEISGYNYQPSADSPLSPNQVIKIGYAFDVRNISNIGTFDFKPLVQRNVEGNWITIGETQVSYSYSDLYKIGGHLLVSFVIQLPSDFDKTTDCVSPRLWCNGDIDATIHGIFMNTNGYDYKNLTDWPFAGESVATTQTMAVTNGYIPSTTPAPYVPTTKMYWKRSSTADIQDGVMMCGHNLYPSDNAPLKAGQVIKVCYCIDITSLGDTGTIVFNPISQRESQGWALKGYTTIQKNFSDLTVKSGKVILSFVIQLQSDFDATLDCIVPQLTFNGDITAKWNWIYITGDAYNCGALQDYAFTLEARATSDSMIVTNRYTPSSDYVPDTTMYWQAWSGANIQSGKMVQGLNIYPKDKIAFKSGQVIKVCYCVDITSLGDTGTILFQPLLQRETESYRSTGWTTISANFSDLNVKTGKVVLSFVVQLSDEFDSTVDCVVPRITFNGDITAKVDWIYVMGDGYNCGAFPEYAFGLEAKATVDNMAVTNRYTPSVAA